MPSVKAKWIKSVSTDIVSQKLDVFSNNVKINSIVVGPTVTEQVLDVPSGPLKVEVTVANQVLRSNVSSATLTVPGVPAPVTNLTLEIVVPATV